MQIDPNVMNQQMEEDRGQREGRYQKRTEFNQQQTETFHEEAELAYDPGTRVGTKKVLMKKALQSSSRNAPKKKKSFQGCTIPTLFLGASSSEKSFL